MFTGIIEELGSVEGLESRRVGARLRVRCSKVLEDAAPGSSVAINGVCLTIVEFQRDSFAADVAPETLRRSNLSDLRPGSLVNLERPVPAGGRLGGHIVQGHVDGAAEFLSLEPLGDQNWWLRVRVPPDIDRYVVFKGSIAIDGISLTIAEVDAGVLSTTVIPHTYQNTNLHARRLGDRVNLECDILAKYLEKLLEARGALPRSSKLTTDKLRELGY